MSALTETYLSSLFEMLNYGMTLTSLLHLSTV